MVMKIKDPSDPKKEIEVYTKAELDAATKQATDTAAGAASKLADEKAQQAIDSYKASNPDRTSEIEKLKNDLSAKEAELQQALSYKGGDDPARDAQIKRIQEERDAQVRDLTSKITALTKQVTDFQAAAGAASKSALLDKYVGSDPDARKKVELEFDNYRSNETTPEQMAARMEKAVQLAGVTKPQTPGALDGAGGQGGARGAGDHGAGAKPVSQNAAAIGKAFGITEKELADQAAKNAEKAAANQ